LALSVTSIGLKGLEGYRVTVEVQIQHGPESITIVGLPDASVRESKRRVAAALHSSGYPLTGQKIMINLSPAEQRKNGPLFDLPMAIAILLKSHYIDVPLTDEVALIGALSLDGAIQPATGLLPAILSARKLGVKTLYIPYDEHLPPLAFEKINIVQVTSLNEVIAHLAGKPVKQPISPRAKQESEPFASPRVEFQQIIGHTGAKYALEVAAAGGHHLLMTGPPGCGKSLLAESIQSILPPLSEEAQLEVLSIYQLSGMELANIPLPPFRNPHHSASGVSIIGGGQHPKPGEISLAHHGVLFLDEMAEFARKTLELLRQPLESGMITISRARQTVTYPAEFILIGALNPCPCGYSGSNYRYCVCTKKEIISYQNKLSGPIRDRFDIHVFLRPIDLSDSAIQAKQETSAIVRKRVTEARQRQYERYRKEITNNRVSFETLMADTPLSNSQLEGLQQKAVRYNWSNRAQIKIIRLARTIADLEQNGKITDQNLSDAIKLRSLHLVFPQEGQSYITVTR
jgi:magnesium chelatase family protein